MQQTHNFKPATVSIPCHIRDIKNFILRKHKYLHSVEQYSKYESLPNQLLLKFLKRVQRAKTLKSFTLKWSYFPACHVKPDIVKSIFRHQCKSIEKFDVFALCDGAPYPYKNLSVSLKSVTAACLYTNVEVKRLQSLFRIEKLTLKLNLEIPNYSGLQMVLRRLPRLKNLYFVVSPNAFAGVLRVVDQLNNIVKRQSINIEISVEGDQEHITLPKLKAGTRERIMKMNFQSIRSNPLLFNLLTEKLPSFKHLKTLVLGFSDINTQTAYCLGYLAEIPKLENLVLVFSESRLKNIAAEVVRRLRLPSTLLTLELSMPLYLKSLITKSKHVLKNSIAANSNMTWRYNNIFDEEPAFNSFFQSLAAAKGIKSITLDMNLLEVFNPHYTNFIVSILNRVPNLISFEAYIKDITPQESKEKGDGCFDLAPFLSTCSKMRYIEQIEISMPNLLFDDAVFNPATNKLKSFTIGVNEADEDRPVKFANLSKFVKKMLQTLLKTSPDLINLTLDFAEVVDEKKLLDRFKQVRKFQRLEGLGLRYILKDCDRNTAREVGRALQSLPRLNTMVLKFFDSDKHIYGIQNYIKYHRSIRDMLVQLNESSWIDNDYFMDPLRAQIMQDFLVEDEGGEEA